MPSFLASVFTTIIGRSISVSGAVTILLPLIYNAVECAAFAILFRAARRKNARDISLQTCVALAMSPTFSTILDVSYWYIWKCKVRHEVELTIGWWMLVAGPAVVAALAWACSWQLYKQGALKEEDDSLLDVERWPRWMSWGSVYAVAGLATAVVTVVVCQLTPEGFAALQHFETVATFMNFMHAFALLPQLVLSRRKGFVAPTAVKFLLLLGIKHILEFVIDFRTSMFIAAGRGAKKDAGCLLADLLAAFVLVDFLYLWSVTTYKVGVKRGIKAFDLGMNSIV